MLSTYPRKQLAVTCVLYILNISLMAVCLMPWKSFGILVGEKTYVMAAMAMVMVTSYRYLTLDMERQCYSSIRRPMPNWLKSNLFLTVYAFLYSLASLVLSILFLAKVL